MPAAAEQPRKVPWEEIRLASIAGVPDETLAREYNVTREAIRQQRRRGQWPTESRVELERQKARESMRDGRSTLKALSRDIETEEENLSQPVTALSLIAKTKEEYGESNRMLLRQKLSPLLQKAVTTRIEDFDPDNLDQLIKLGTFTHKMAGLDRPQTAIQLNLWGSGSSGTFHAESGGSPFGEE
jgi:hypothetical protein